MSVPSSEHPAPPAEKADPETPPPILGTWRRFYAVVIANTLLVYLALFLFSLYARPSL